MILEQLTDHTWMLPPGADKRLIQPTVGVVVGEDATLLYDAASSPAHAQRVLAGLREIDAPPVRYVVYSHHHWDHVFGGQVFAEQGDNVQFIAHESFTDHMQNFVNRPWNSDYLRERGERLPQLKLAYAALDAGVPDWNTFRIVLPDATVSDSTYHVDLRNLTVEIEHVGGEHALDSVILRVPSDRILFLSDCFYPPFSSANGDKPRSNTGMIRRFLNEGMAVYVDGHNGRIWR